ncbi:MAG: 2-oxoacid:acceptor oxidoreductase family protein [Nitrososphaeria archaeon]
MASREEGRFRVLASGRGGLGVIELGNFIAYYMMAEGRRASVVPVYGPQTRGGKVEVMVVGATGSVDNPIPTSFDALIAVDSPALESLGRVVEGGFIIYNEPLVKAARNGRVREFSVEGTRIAEELAAGKLREPRVLTSAALFGAFLAALGGDAHVENPVRAALAGRPPEIVELNVEAARRGYRSLRGPL